MLLTKKGRAIYAKRKEIVEPVFGQTKRLRGFRQFLLRGLKKVVPKVQFPVRKTAVVLRTS